MLPLGRGWRGFNYLLPISVVCLALLFLVHRNNPVGMGFLIMISVLVIAAARVEPPPTRGDAR